MQPIKPLKGVGLISTFCFLVIFTFYSSVSLGNTDKGSIRFNPEYRLKSYSGNVTVYTVTDKGDKIEYTFSAFNADVLLLVYRRLDLVQITDRLARKYGLSKKVSRRHVKMTLNTLELWDIIIRN